MEMLKHNLVPCIVIDIAYDVNIADWWVDRFIVLLMLAMCMWLHAVLFTCVHDLYIYLFIFCVIELHVCILESLSITKASVFRFKDLLVKFIYTNLLYRRYLDWVHSQPKTGCY